MRAKRHPNGADPFRRRRDRLLRGAGIDAVGAGIDAIGAGIDAIGAGIDAVGSGVVLFEPGNAFPGLRSDPFDTVD